MGSNCVKSSLENAIFRDSTELSVSEEETLLEPPLREAPKPPNEFMSVNDGKVSILRESNDVNDGGINEDERQESKEKIKNKVNKKERKHMKISRVHGWGSQGRLGEMEDIYNNDVLNSNFKCLDLNLSNTDVGYNVKLGSDMNSVIIVPFGMYLMHGFCDIDYDEVIPNEIILLVLGYLNKFNFCDDIKFYQRYGYNKSTQEGGTRLFIEHKVECPVYISKIVYDFHVLLDRDWDYTCQRKKMAKTSKEYLKIFESARIHNHEQNIKIFVLYRVKSLYNLDGNIIHDRINARQMYFDRYNQIRDEIRDKAPNYLEIEINHNNFNKFWKHNQRIYNETEIELYNDHYGKVYICQYNNKLKTGFEITHSSLKSFSGFRMNIIIFIECILYANYYKNFMTLSNINSNIYQGSTHFGKAMTKLKQLNSSIFKCQLFIFEKQSTNIKRNVLNVLSTK